MVDRPTWIVGRIWGPTMELADTLSIPVHRPMGSPAVALSDGWYDPDSVAFAQGAEAATTGLTRIDAARRREIFAALPPGLRPLSLLVRVRRESMSSR
jgi:hypothetical protein